MFDKSYYVDPSVKTPQINFDAQSGIFELKGRSLPENSVQYYLPMFIWLEHYTLNPAPQTILNIQLDYFNSSSSKSIANLFMRLVQISKSGKSKVVINWLYNEQDDDMLEAGEDFKSIIEIQFNIVSIK
ncbi:MAG: hypothetical protein A2X08_11655 [Bacteroidetes bacterium GWA2_32_17]|nr:MAG: hypothetical protein A2X08_11655 [Bacteroidetes bacterium GWA2_32_17]